MPGERRAATIYTKIIMCAEYAQPFCTGVTRLSVLFCALTCGAQSHKSRACH